jgi:hypothetical protein
MRPLKTNNSELNFVNLSINGRELKVVFDTLMSVGATNLISVQLIFRSAHSSGASFTFCLIKK